MCLSMNVEVSMRTLHAQAHVVCSWRNLVSAAQDAEDLAESHATVHGPLLSICVVRNVTRRRRMHVNIQAKQ